MSNLNYPGENWKITGTLTDSTGAAIAFADIVSMSVTITDEMQGLKTYTKADSEIVVGATSSSYALEILAADTVDFYEGVITGFFTIEFPSTDFTGNAIDKICIKLLTCGICP